MEEYQRLESLESARPRRPRCGVSLGRGLAVFGSAIVIAIFSFIAVMIYSMVLSLETMVVLLRDVRTNTRSMCDALQAVDKNYTCA